VIVEGVFVPAEHCAALGRALLAGQTELRRDGIVSPVAAKYTEECLRVARARTNLARGDGARAPSVSVVHFHGSREAARISGWSIRSVQSLAASGAIGRRVDGRFLFSESEVRELARRRRQGAGDRPGAPGRAPGRDGRRGRGVEGSEGEGVPVVSRRA
jgi:hypothetical protein